jgi:glycosyltransferase involved in cell wall biosynthesis
VKILLVADFSVVHSRRYLEIIRKAGCEVILLDNRRSAQFSGAPAEHYYLWPRNGYRFARHLFGSRLAGKLSEFLVRLQLRWLWTITRPDIAHVQWIDDRAWLLAKAGISPLILTPWGSDLNVTRDLNHDPALRRRKAEAISKTALLIADSQDMIDIANNLAAPPVPSLLLPIGIDTQLFRPGMKAEALNWRREIGIPDVAKVALSPRAFRQDYGHDIIVKAFGRAIKNKNIDAYLVFKAYDCRDKDYVNDITAIASDCGIQNRIRIVDEVSYDRLPIFYAMGDFAINFPTMDAFPVTFLECLSCELPILTKHLPSYDSLGISPYLCFTDAPTEESLEKGISSMLSSAHVLQQDMSPQARAYVSAKFDESVVANTLVQAYRRVLEGCSKP